MYNLDILYVENKYASLRMYEIRVHNIPHYELLEIWYAHKRIRKCISRRGSIKIG